MKPKVQGFSFFGLITLLYLFPPVSMAVDSPNIQLAANVYGSDMAIKNFKQNWFKYGISFDKNGTNIEVVVNVSNVIYSWPNIVSDEYISGDATSGISQKTPINFVFPISMRYAWDLLGLVFKNNPKAGFINLQCYFVLPDASDKKLCYSLRINQDMYKALVPSSWADWNKKAYLSVWCTETLEQELKGE